MARHLELKLVVPRWQRWFAWASFLAWELLAVAVFLSERRWGGADWLLLLMRLVQGGGMAYAIFGCFATLLEVDGDTLVVTTLWRKLLRRPGLREPLDTAALEWIGGRLTLQRPADGFVTQLGCGPAAREAADWLVAQGVHPPVGG